MLAVGLIHMNGRLYDPLLHRFLSPDNYVQDPFNSQNYNRYAYVLNNPLAHIDPSGEIIPLLVFVGAAIIGGGANVWSNWDKIVKNPWSAVSYFASGAVGGAVSVVNPWLGGSITGVANIGVDAAYGNIPKFSGFKDVAKYLGGKVLDGLGAAGAGGISKWGYNLAGKLGWIQTGAFNATSFLVGAGTEGVASSVTAPEFILKNTRTTILEPLLETGANTGTKLLGTARNNLLNTIQDTKLYNMVNDLYRPGATIGSGSTADFIREVGDTGHIIKGKNYVKGLESLINSGKLAGKDSEIAKYILNDLQDALKLAQ